MSKKYFALEQLNITLIFTFFFTSNLLADPAFWKIKDKDFYFLGSIHVADSSLYPLDSLYQNALAKTDFLAVESDVTDPEMVKKISNIMLQLMMNSKSSLNDQIQEKDRAYIDSSFANMGINFEMFKQMPSWLLALQLSQMELMKLGYDQNLGVDLHFLNLAKSSQKEVVSLESPELTLTIFSQLPNETQYQLFISTLDELKEAETKYSEILTAYKQGDLNYIEAELIDHYYKERNLDLLMDELLINRNKKMVEPIIEFLKTEKSGFVVVGLAHLVGKNSILDLLTQAGYEIERLK